MNVLMVDQYGQTGGAQKCLLDLIAGWPREDALMVAAPAEGTLLRSVRDAGFITEAIPCGPYTGRGVTDALRLLADAHRQRAILRRLIRRFAADVVYVNGPRVLPGAALAARGHCPLVYHAWNLLRRRADRAIVRLSLGSCRSAVIACCAYSGGTLPATVILNGVPDAGFRHRRYPPKGPWRVGVVGRISPEKGHLVLMDAIRLLTADGHAIALMVAGAPLFSSNEYEAEVRRRAEGLDVRFAGWIDDIGPFLAELDLSVVPSIAEPGPTRVIPEAFSAGAPVVALPTGGIPEVISDGQNGFLAAGVTARDLADALTRAMLAPPADLAAITRRAREEWESYWNVDRWCREVVAAIRAGAMPEPARDSCGVSVASSEGRPAPSE
jgi:glycosyltransferase involved in cell wall biosynthesis